MSNFRQVFQGTSYFVGDVTMNGNLTVGGNLTFSSVAVDALVLGRLATGSVAGITNTLGAAYAYTDANHFAYSISSYTGIGASSTFVANYTYVENAVANTTASVHGSQNWAVAANVNTGMLFGISGIAYIKGTTARSVGPSYGVAAELKWDTGASNKTLTTEATALRARIRGGAAASYTIIHGLIIDAGDVDGNARTYGSGILFQADATDTGAITWTNGLLMAMPATNGVKVTGTGTSAFVTATGTWTNGILLGGTLTTGISIGAATTGIAITGATTTAISVTGSATTALNVGTGTFTTGLALAGTLTNAITIGTCTTGISLNGATITNEIVGKNADTLNNSASTLWNMATASLRVGADVGSGASSTTTFTNATVSGASGVYTATNGPGSSTASPVWVKIYVGSTAKVIAAYPAS